MDTLYKVTNVVVYLNAILAEGWFRWVQLGLGIIMTLVGIAYRVWKWYKEAKADGKITKEELKELTDDVKDDVIKVVEDTTTLINGIKEDKNSGE